MKKLITVVLILALLLPAAALADESDFIGCWAHYDRLESGAPSISVLYLAEGNVCYYVAQYFHADSAGPGRTYIGTWEMDSSNTLTAQIGENTKISLYLSAQGGAALDTKTFDLYVNLKSLMN